MRAIVTGAKRWRGGGRVRTRWDERGCAGGISAGVRVCWGGKSVGVWVCWGGISVGVRVSWGGCEGVLGGWL